MPVKLFVSYSHKDKDQLDTLLLALRPLERDGLVAPWTDRLIDVGENWQEKISSALDDYDLGLFLLSIPFLGSDFIHAKELGPMLERANSSGIRLVPVLLRDCDWENTALRRSETDTAARGARRTGNRPGLRHAGATSDRGSRPRAAAGRRR